MSMVGVSIRHGLIALTGTFLALDLAGFNPMAVAGQTSTAVPASASSLLGPSEPAGTCPNELISDRDTCDPTHLSKRRLAELDQPVPDRVLRHIAALTDDPRPPNVTRLVGTDNLWQIRIGDYRVVYGIHDGELIVHIIQMAYGGAPYRDS